MVEQRKLLERAMVALGCWLLEFGPIRAALSLWVMILVSVVTLKVFWSPAGMIEKETVALGLPLVIGLVATVLGFVFKKKAEK